MRAPERPRAAIFDDSGSILGPFSSFFEVASRERLDSEREGPNLCFCWQAQHFQGFADFAEKAKMDEKSLRRCFANESPEQNSIFSLPDTT